MSFRREKYIPRGGPDGGNGGDGGSVYLVAEKGLNTLVDFRHTRLYLAANGRPGAGKDRIGKSADDLKVKVPLGTLVYDNNTNELIGDLITTDACLLVAKGGYHGLGNARFKSSTNRAPRKTTNGAEGEIRELRLEMRVLADVGLLGLPNAGKSTFISQVSAARPKVADYPFTTLYPNLGVVRVRSDQSFVVADIPGLIEGATEGTGLGISFLKHLSRTKLLLHIVDVGIMECDEIVEQIRVIERELLKYNAELFQRDRWLVLNKIDLLEEEKLELLKNNVIDSLEWQKPVHCISVASGKGCTDLVSQIQLWMDKDSIEDFSDDGVLSK